MVPAGHFVSRTHLGRGGIVPPPKLVVCSRFLASNNLCSGRRGFRTHPGLISRPPPRSCSSSKRTQFPRQTTESMERPMQFDEIIAKSENSKQFLESGSAPAAQDDWGGFFDAPNVGFVVCDE